MSDLNLTLNCDIKVTPVILCGGSGTRLWPLSRTAFPKQFLVLSGNTTLFQQTVERLQYINRSTFRIDKTLIVTNEEHRFLVLDQLRETGSLKTEVILEPVSRNTAPALTLAALQSINAGEDPVLFVIPSDQTIRDNIAFAKCLHDAIQVASNGSIVIFGIKPSTPNTGFGYIKKNKTADENKACKVLSFTEKPDLATAKKYFASEDYFWNSGMFVLRASVWLEAIQTLSPDIYNLTLNAFNHKKNDNLFIRPDKKIFEYIPSSSIDYSVIEKCQNSNFEIKMVTLDAGWNDLGSWDEVWQIGEKNKDGNVSYGDTFFQNTENSLVYASDRFVATSDIKDLLVIETADSVMVINRNCSQNVKSLVNKLHLQKREEQNLHRKVSRPWGWFNVLDEELKFKVKRICVYPGESLSLQKHKHRAEHWVVVRGVAEIKCGLKNIILEKNQSTFIPQGELHQLGNPGKEILEIVEVQSGDYLGEDDIERIEDKYGRE